MSSPVVLINVFEVPVGEEKTFIAWWEKSSAALKQEEGFLDATLHQSLKPGARFQFVNVAHWQTAACLDRARTRHAEILHSLTVGKGFPALYEVASQY